MTSARRNLAMVVAAAFTLSACGSDATVSSAVSASSEASARATATSSVATTAPPLTALPSPTTRSPAPAETVPTVVRQARHLDHAALAARLPSAGDLSWLPLEVRIEDDSDLTSRLGIVDCSRSPTVVPSREPSATNRRYIIGQENRAEITFYDVETIDDARAFMSALDTLTRCPSPPSTVVTFDVVDLGSSAGCDEVLVTRTHQPVSETIDAWCRVANLVAWIRLYPSGVLASDTDPAAAPPIPPTDAQADETVSAAASALQAGWSGAG